MPTLPSPDLAAVLAADAEARRRATAHLPAATP